MRKMGHKEHLENGEGGSDKIHFQERFWTILLDPQGMGRLANGVYTVERKPRRCERGWEGRNNWGSHLDTPREVNLT